MSALERRYCWLLRAYPVWYLEDRGGEMLGTLLEASTPCQSWPSARDAAALLTGGLRVRAGRGLREAAGLRLVVLLAVVLDLTGYAAGMLGWAFGGDTFPSWPYQWVDLATALVTLAAVAGAWSGRRLVTAVVALTAAGLWVYQPPGYQLAAATGPVLALVALAVLAGAAWRRCRWAARGCPGCCWRPARSSWPWLPSGEYDARTSCQARFDGAMTASPKDSTPYSRGTKITMAGWSEL